MILSRIILTFVGTVVIGLFLAGCGSSTVAQTKADMPYELQQQWNTRTDGCVTASRQ